MMEQRKCLLTTAGGGKDDKASRGWHFQMKEKTAGWIW